ncbi:NAD-dependent epimerase/dehydratase family protein [Variovorax sp. LT1P1]|uniref:NAD-dependent epimerase/dehydratase family protein n=1 Tax=Variovorax sp. LT1P1 TaxID=3443730 RepID=UPI003F471C3B
MIAAWVLGAGGLLGSALSRALLGDGVKPFSPAERFNWVDEVALRSQLSAAVTRFSSAAMGASVWQIYWAAGVGTMNATEDALRSETCALACLLELIGADRRLMHMKGVFILASSAGAIYAASKDELITELSVPAPNSAYGFAKIRQENLVSAFCAGKPKTTALLARISTLYGSGQARDKSQGLLTHIARSIICNKPVGIYVPIDTIRDYISVDDAAEAIVQTIPALDCLGDANVKVVASECPTTIAEIISIFRRLCRKSPRITTGINRSASLYSRRVQFRSVVLNQRGRKIRSLTVGIAELLNAERISYANPAAPISKSVG